MPGWPRCAARRREGPASSPAARRVPGLGCGIPALGAPPRRAAGRAGLRGGQPGAAHHPPRHRPPARLAPGRGMPLEAVRSATPEDLPAIVALAEALRSELTPMRGGRIWAVREARRGPLDEAYGALLTDAAAYVVVGTLDDVVIGFGVATVEP